MRTQRLVLRVLCAKDGAQQPSTPPEPPPRRITGRVGGLSVGRQRELLKRYKVRGALGADTKADAAGRPPCPADAASLAPQEREEQPQLMPVRRSRPAPAAFVQSSAVAQEVRFHHAALA